MKLCNSSADYTAFIIDSHGPFFFFFHVLLDMRDYALGIGMNLEEDSDLLWIAREGLKAALPKGWVPWFARVT